MTNQYQNHHLAKVAESSENSKRRLPKASAAVAIGGAAILALTAGMFTVASLALFTDQETVGANVFSTGSVDLATSPTTAVVTLTAMLPGDEVTAPLTISNSGSLEFRYAATSTTTEDVLAAGLDLTIRTGVTACDDANWDADGTVIYATGDLGSTTGVALIGDVATGNQTGDRTLAATASEVLCLNVTLPANAPNTLQGLTTTASFVFQAEQTANN